MDTKQITTEQVHARGLRILSIELAGGILPNGADGIVSALVAVSNGGDGGKIIADHAASCYSHGYHREGELTEAALNAAKDGWFDDFLRRYYEQRRLNYNYF